MSDFPSRPVARYRRQTLVVRDLTVASHIGVSDEEQEQPQRLRINLEVAVEAPRPLEDRLERVVDYTDFVPEIRRLCLTRRPRLLETLADEIANLCLRDRRARSARVRVEKLDLHPDAAGVGVEVTYDQPTADSA